MASLAEIRAKLASMENNKSSSQSSTGGDNAIYPHWNIDEGTSATMRFLPGAANSLGKLSTRKPFHLICVMRFWQPKINGFTAILD